MWFDDFSSAMAVFNLMRGWQVVEFFHGRALAVPFRWRSGQRAKGRRDRHLQARSCFPAAADALGTLEELKEQGVGLHMIVLAATSPAMASAN